MKLDKLVGDRFKERPAECSIDSHALMVRGGYMKFMASGIYSQYMPLKRILRKIENIIREEMDAIDGQEVLFPVVMPGSLWEESGRYNSIASELLRFKDRTERGHDPPGDIKEGLLRFHDGKVIIRLHTEDFQHAVQHLPVLSGHADNRTDALPGFQFLYQGAHLDCFRSRSKDHHHCFHQSARKLTFSALPVRQADGKASHAAGKTRPTQEKTLTATEAEVKITLLDQVLGSILPDETGRTACAARFRYRPLLYHTGLISQEKQALYC